MERSFTELQKSGIKGSILFWMRLILLVIPVSYIAFLLYWMVITGSKIWLKAVGGQILTTCFFTMLLSICSIVMLFFVWFNILGNMDKAFKYQIFVVINVITLFLSCILLALSTYGQASQCSSDISDYITRHSTDSIVTSFLSDYPTSASQSSYVLRRTSDAYTINAVFFAIWLISLFIAIICNYMIDSSEKAEKEAQDEQNLLAANNADNKPNEAGADADANANNARSNNLGANSRKQRNR